MASTKMYRVRPGCAISSNAGLLKPGTVFSSEGWNPVSIESNLKTGHIEKVSGSMAPVNDGVVEDAPGRERRPALPGAETAEGPKLSPPPPVRTVSVSNGSGINVEQSEPSEPQTRREVEIAGRIEHAPSRWTLDPETLKGKDLEQLNVMVKERDENERPFETVPEAVAFLSRDFKPPAAPAAPAPQPARPAQPQRPTPPQRPNPIR